MSESPKQSQDQLDPEHKFATSKIVLMTPAIATFEKLVSELKMIRDETHPVLINARAALDAQYKEECQQLDANLEYELKFMDKQKKFEDQQIEDEIEESLYLFHHQNK